LKKPYTLDNHLTSLDLRIHSGDLAEAPLFRICSATDVGKEPSTSSAKSTWVRRQEPKPKGCLATSVGPPETWTGGHFRVLWDGFLMASMFRSIDISGPSHPRALGTASLPKLRSSADSATTDCCSLSQDARSTSGDGRIRSSFRADSARVERADCWVGDLWQLDHRTRLNLHQALDLLQMNWCLEQYKYFRVDFYQISGMVSSKKH
jgi:hypothetical protein